jgi:hypothetical protein
MNSRATRADAKKFGVVGEAVFEETLVFPKSRKCRREPGLSITAR